MSILSTFLTDDALKSPELKKFDEEKKQVKNTQEITDGTMIFDINMN
jgi:hypothetical protein